MRRSLGALTALVPTIVGIGLINIPASAEYCYILVGGTMCVDVPDEGAAQREAEYVKWMEENLDQSGVTILLPDGTEVGLEDLPELPSEVIGVTPGPLLEGTNSRIETPTSEIKETTHEPTVVTPTVQEDYQVTSSPEVVEVPTWTCKINFKI